MIKLLILDNQILAINPVDFGNYWETSDQIIPKHVAEGAVIVEVLDLPVDYSPGKYTYDGKFIPVQIVVTTPVPQSVSPRQIRQALTRTNLRQSVEAAISSGDQDTKDWYEYATEFVRTNPHVIAMGLALNVSEQQLDDLWRLAGSL